ncbi:MAG: feruloyl-CoA synthase [Cytophagales bacterium]|nr:feruloyl-CoA synthase [Cytophagales bacterium]
MSSTRSPAYRDFTFGITKGELTRGADGVHYLRSVPLAAYPERITDRFIHHAKAHPAKTFMAQRLKNADGSKGDWRHLTWGEALQGARRIAQALLMRGLSAERPVAILSENDLEHAQLILGCIYAGVPYCSVSPAYSTISQDFEKLRHVLSTLTPGLVFAADQARYGPAIAAAVAQDVEVVYSHLVRAELVEAQAGTSTNSVRADMSFAKLLATPATDAVDAAMQATNGDTIVKFLFTSGSTKLPKAVINTQRMWCANQEQMVASMPVLKEGWHTLVDWLPWNHTFSGNHNFGLIMYNGGTIYIDEGKPTPALIGETLRNLREISPTIYLNVPTGFEYIAEAMKQDDQLRRTLLSRVQMFFYAGAALAQPIWDSLFESQEREIGERIVMTTGLGMTESSPFALFVTHQDVKAGYLGLPTAGLMLKLVPNNGKVEVRYKGDNITPGYWRNPEATQESFDEEGFFCTGDAVQWIDENNIHQGLKFDGRIAEDFKLATGTFVSVGPLRAKIIAAGAPYVQDVVLTGLNMKEVGAMIFPLPAARALDQSTRLAHFQKMMNELAKTATGSASRIARMIVLDEPPSIDKGEVTDKGSINQRAVLTHRAKLVEALHNDAVEGIIKPE